MKRRQLRIDKAVLRVGQGGVTMRYFSSHPGVNYYPKTSRPDAFYSSYNSNARKTVEKGREEKRKGKKMERKKGVKKREGKKRNP